MFYSQIIYFNIYKKYLSGLSIYSMLQNIFHYIQYMNTVAFSSEVRRLVPWNILNVTGLSRPIGMASSVWAAWPALSWAPLPS